MHDSQFTFDSPDEVRQFPHGQADVLNTEAGPVARLVLHPGWKWSSDVKPIAGTEWCEAPHFQYHVSGRIHIAMSDGHEFDVGPGEISALAPGHDAWVVGDDDVVLIDFGGASNYARPAATA